MKNGISKDQSKMLRGIAILMMLYHHLFSTPEALGIPYISLLNFNGVNAELRMAWFFKICVGIYAFVTGYGLCRLCNKGEKVSLPVRLKQDGRLALKQIRGLYKQFWLVFVLFMGIGFLFFHKQFVWKEFLLNFLGLSNSYNGAWWYMYQYLKMLVVFPVMDCFFQIYKDKGSKLGFIVFYGILLIIFGFLYITQKQTLDSILDYFQPAYFLCYIVGYLIARFSLYELCAKLFPTIVLRVLGVLAFVLVIAARAKIAKDASSAGLDFIFVPVFVFGVIQIIELVPALGRIFLFFGKCSTFMWLVHVFYYDHYLKKVVMFSHVSIGIYLTLLALSTLTAIGLNYLMKLINKGLKKKSSKK